MDTNRTAIGLLAGLAAVVTIAFHSPLQAQEQGLGANTHSTFAITVDDVIDASRNVNVDAVIGWLAEVAPRFQGLSLEDLIRLDDAGVATAVIDMVVELSFPEHFALDEETDGDDDYRWYGHGNQHRHGYWQPGPAVVVIEKHRPVRPTGSTGVVTGDPKPPAKSGRPGQVVAGKGYRKPESTTSSGCSSGSKSSSCKGGTGRKAVRRGGK